MAAISVSFDVDDSTFRSVVEQLLGNAQPGEVHVRSSREALRLLLRADLNEKEREVLTTLAEAAPDLVTHDVLLGVCGSPQKYGNVMSGLNRRWQSRSGGVEIPTPWQDAGEGGYQMAAEAAQRVLEALGASQGPPPDGPESTTSTRGPQNEWAQYEERYRARPETFNAYVDVWNRVPGVRETFGGWASFSQAANNEPSQRTERVQLAEGFMRAGGYEVGPATPHGGRQWVRP